MSRIVERLVGDPKDFLRGLAIAFAAGLFMAFSGAFFGNAAALPVRLFYWVLLMVGGALYGGVLSRALGEFTGLRERPVVFAVVLTLAIGAPYTVVVWAVSGLAFGGRAEVASLPYFFAPVLMVSAAMTGITMLASQRPRETHAAAEGAGPPRFLERLPLKLRGAEVWAVEAEDHYLRVHTDRGSDLILMRLSDAVTELEGIEGAQTHRSWWVAKAAVVDAERGDGRATFTLKSGVKVPVSRTYAKVLRAEGWY